MEDTGTPNGRGEVREWDPLTVQEVATILRVPKRQVRRLGIPVVQLGPRTLRYMRKDVEEFVRRKQIGPTDGRQR